MYNIVYLQVSGGEDGARHGPSLMPGGHTAAWPHIKPIFQVFYEKYKIIGFLNLLFITK